MRSENSQGTISLRWNNFLEDLEKFCDLEGRKLPKIVVVSKTRTIDEMQLAWDEGIRIFGENYAQELAQKANAFPNAEWHFLGHLQRGNIKHVHPIAQFIHSVDSIKLVKRLEMVNFKGQCFVQVNLSGDSGKFGIPFDEVSIGNFLAETRNYKLKITGFMGMGDFAWSDTEVRNNYSNFSKMISQFNLQELSLGMSDDYKIGLKHGSSIIRIGTRIFGPRK